MARSIFLALGGALAAFVAFACGGGDDIQSSWIFVAPPWDGRESATYRVEDKGVEGEGTCVLTTLPETEPGRTTLERDCTKDPFRDTGRVTVDSGTLEPFFSERIYVDGEKGERTTYTVTYEGTIAIFTVEKGDDRNETERDLPEPDETSPDPGWYDDESLLWLARGIPLEDGFEGGYTHVINAGQPRILPVEVRVEGTEQVEVPAGTFTAWKVRFQRESLVYFVWVDAESPNRVVRARIEDVTYDLTGFE